MAGGFSSAPASQVEIQSTIYLYLARSNGDEGMAYMNVVRGISLPTALATVVLAWAAGMAGVPRADASTFVVPELDELVAMSAAVVQGVVVSREYRVDEGGRIVTDYQVTPTTTVVGQLDPAPGATLIFTFPGGTDGDETELVTGVPVFTPGDEVVLFLKQTVVRQGQVAPQPGFMLVTGMAVGALKIERDPAGDAAPRVRGLAARAFNRDRERKTAIESKPTPDTAPLTDFLDAIRQMKTKGDAR